MVHFTKTYSNLKGILLLGLAGIPLFLFGQANKVTETNSELWYAQPAEEWMQALPVGNGRLGAMVFGDPTHERIQLNEDSMWPGAPDWGNHKGDSDDLRMIRQLLNTGMTRAVDSLIIEKFSYKSVLRSHQTMGDLFIDFDKTKVIENYARSLDLKKAIVTIRYTSEGETYSQKVFASAPHDALVIELATSAKQGMDFSLRLDRPEDHGRKTVTVSNPTAREISMKGMVTQYGGKKFDELFPITQGVQFETRLKVANESGTVEVENGKLILRNVRKATIFIVANTSFYHENFVKENDNSLNFLDGKSFETLLKAHINDYQKWYNRVDFTLGNAILDTLATDARLQRIKNGKSDPGLAAILFQYGRYLLISSSRQGTNPANLQGIWNEHIEAPWNADYHLNINLQMNYWPAEVTNLSGLHMPLFDFGDRLYQRGKITAKEQYGLEGTMAHHATDLWAPAWMRAARAYWGAWIHGGGWLSQHYWTHYQFTNDREFLKTRAFPVLSDLAKFYSGWLVFDTALGYWVSTPETSPENSYVHENGESAAISYGAAMGHQIIGEVFDNFLESAALLGVHNALVAEVREKRRKLHPGVLIGDDGRILEWNKAYDEPEKGHRHMSHLYALHPGEDIVEADSDAFAAAQKTIDYRLKHGGAGTGWSRAWMINMNARLLDSVAAGQNIRKFFEISLADNLFDEHPPFQIDGNFGYTAGVAELLLQSHEGFLRILPALPTEWQTGAIKGLKARGNIEVDIWWNDGKLKKIGLLAKNKKTIKLKYKSTGTEVVLPENSKIFVDRNFKEVN